MSFFAGAFVYLAILIFIVAGGKRILDYQTMPRHFRWDLYPVPHQGPQGSKYQKVDFYQAPRESHIEEELVDMGQEMFFIKKAFVHNPRLWKASFPFHAGLYLLGGWLALLVIGALLDLAGIEVWRAGTLPAMAVRYLTLWVGAAGLVLGTYGTLALLYLRYTDEGLKAMSTFITYLVLYVMLFLFVSGLLAWLIADPTFSQIRAHVLSLLTFHPTASPHPLIALEAFAFGVFLIMLPFTRMMHFAAKYFFYHNIMWDDESMKAGSKMSQDITGYLSYKIDWSAPHLKKDGSWVDQVAKDEPDKGKEVKPNA